MTQLCTRWQRHNWTKQKHIHTNRAIWMEQIVRRARAQLVKIPNNRLCSGFVCISFFWVWCDARQCAIFCNIKDSQIHNNPQATLLSTNIDVQTPSVLSSFNSHVANRTTKDNNSRKHGRTHSCHCFVLLWTTLFRQWRVVRASLAFTACPNIHYTHITSAQHYSINKEEKETNKLPGRVSSEVCWGHPMWTRQTKPGYSHQHGAKVWLAWPFNWLTGEVRRCPRWECWDPGTVPHSGTEED